MFNIILSFKKTTNVNINDKIENNNYHDRNENNLNY